MGKEKKVEDNKRRQQRKEREERGNKGIDGTIVKDEMENGRSWDDRERKSG